MKIQTWCNISRSFSSRCFRSRTENLLMVKLQMHPPWTPLPVQVLIRLIFHSIQELCRRNPTLACQKCLAGLLNRQMDILNPRLKGINHLIIKGIIYKKIKTIIYWMLNRNWRVMKSKLYKWHRWLIRRAISRTHLNGPEIRFKT